MSLLQRSAGYLKASVAIIALFLGALISFAGWIEDKDGKTIIHVKVFQLPDPSDTSTFNQAELAAVRQFTKEFPNIFKEKYAAKYKENPSKYGRHNWNNVEIQLHQFSGIQVPDLDSAILAIAGGMAPDVLYLNFMFSDSYIEEKFLYPLDNPEDGYLSSMSEEEKEFRIHPKIWPVVRRKDPQGREQVWALPFGGVLGKVVAYRKDLFDDAKIPYPHNDWNWDEFYEICKKLANPAKGIYPVQFANGKYESWWWINFLWSAGGDCMAYDEAKNVWHCVFDSPEAAIALDFYTKICTEPWIDKNGKSQAGYAYKGEDWNKWTRGEIAMEFQNIDEKLFTHINPDITGLVPVPMGPKGLRGAEINSRMMGLFSGIKDPVVRDAAWEYMKNYDSIASAGIKTRIMVEGGLGKFINPRYLKMFGYEELVRFAPAEWTRCFEIAVESGRPEPYGKGSRIAYPMMSKPIQEADALAREGKLPADTEQRLAVLQGLLNNAVKRANIEMLHIIPPKEQLMRRVSACVVLVGIVLGMLLVLRNTYRALVPPSHSLTSAPKSLWQFTRYKWAYLLLLPALLSILFWQYIPLFRGSAMAFQDYKIMGGSTWVWLDNFGDILWSYEWWLSVWNGLRYSFLVLLLTFLPPVILAILLQEVPWGKTCFRILYYLPAVTTSLVLILLWRMFYEPSEYGVLNMIVMHIPAIAYLLLGAGLFYVAWLFFSRLWYHGSKLGALISLLIGAVLFYTCYSLADPILNAEGAPVIKRLFMTLPSGFRWLLDPNTAMLACVLPAAWAGLGPGSLIYLAALKGIPDDFFEQADIDGATFVDKILFVVFPMLKPLLLINFVGAFIAAWFTAAGNILAMTAGGANTEVAELHIFYKAFIHGKFGPATAMAWILSFILIAFTIQQLRILSSLEFKTTGGKH